MQSILNQQQPGLKKFITASVILHIIILIAGLFLIKTAPSRVLFAPAYTTVELVAPPSGRGSSKGKKTARRRPVKKTASTPKTSSSKKVIIKKTIKKKKAASKKIVIPDAASVSKTAPAPTPAPTPAKGLDAVSTAMAALEQEATEDELIEQRIKELTASDIEAEENLDSEIAGLREEILGSGISVDVLPDTQGGQGRGSGTGFGTGTGSRSSSVNINQLDIAFIEYYNSVGSMIRSEWNFPGSEAPGLQATIAIKIAPDGKVLALRVERASGNALFDRSAVKAVEKVGDFPPLPKELKEEFLEIGIRFCPGGCKQ